MAECQPGTCSTPPSHPTCPRQPARPFSRKASSTGAAGWLLHKSKALISVFSWLRKFQYDYAKIDQHFGPDLRKNLRQLHGVGEETADVMLTYIFERPTFISDKYARTLFNCLGIDGLTNYQSLAKVCHLSPSFDAAMAQDFHGLIDEFGKQHLHPVTNFQESFLAGDKLVLD